LKRILTDTTVETPYAQNRTIPRARTTSFDGTVRSGWHADSGRVNRRFLMFS